MIKERADSAPGLGDKQKKWWTLCESISDKKPVEIWSMVSSNRQSVVALADAKSKQAAPVFVSWFCWKPPLFDNRIGAFHCVDICFWYYNTDLMLTHTGGGARPRKLSTQMAGPLVQFMKTGESQWREISDLAEVILRQRAR
jgi:para-nitrobenzyl esterase